MTANLTVNEGRNCFMRISWTREIKKKARQYSVYNISSSDCCQIFGLFCKYPSKLSHFLSYVAELSASWQPCCRPVSLISQGPAGREGAASAGSFDGGPPRGRRRPAARRWWGAAGCGPRPLLSGCTWPPPPGRGPDKTCKGVICSEKVLLCTVEQGLEAPSLKYRGFASTQQEKNGECAEWRS
jgi:hypothetical protein